MTKRARLHAHELAKRKDMLSQFIVRMENPVSCFMLASLCHTMLHSDNRAEQRYIKKFLNSVRKQDKEVFNLIMNFPF